jgi:predicted ArsR family transcriptional regulator
MTRHLPAEVHVQHKWDQYRQTCERNGQRPSVLGLAAQLDLSNSTFRRHFPSLAKEIATHRTRPAQETNGHGREAALAQAPR